MTVRTRFAPSPTGYLHIGGARTALFNYLFAKRHGGQFLLRVEDTDKERSTQSAKDAIINSLQWLDLIPDEEIIYQSANIERHKEVAKQLVDNGNAYYCYTPQEEINNLREEARAKGEHFIFKSEYRDGNKEAPEGVLPVVRLKAPDDGKTIVQDLLQGDVVVENSHLDDMVLCRADGTPTYMLAAVVDDYDMGITHIIRGDDHLNNASRQQLIYEAMGWLVPKTAHIPLIHGPDGAKLSKRHGALGAQAYKDLGYLPEALNNYLLRLGWSHGDDEIISRDKAIEWFGIDGMGKSPSRIDFDKMKNVNAHYLRGMENYELANIIYSNIESDVSQESKDNILKAIDCIKPRCELVGDLTYFAKIFVVDSPVDIDPEAQEIINNTPDDLMIEIVNSLSKIEDFVKDNIQQSLKDLSKARGVKLGEIMKYVRPYITGMTASPSVFEVVAIIGKQESLNRLKI